MTEELTNITSELIKYTGESQSQRENVFFLIFSPKTIPKFTEKQCIDRLLYWV